MVQWPLRKYQNLLGLILFLACSHLGTILFDQLMDVYHVLLIVFSRVCPDYLCSGNKKVLYDQRMCVCVC